MKTGGGAGNKKGHKPILSILLKVVEAMGGIKDILR